MRQDLLYFLSAVEEMNISKAAKKLSITPQALSAQIRKLEDSYGVTLFDRTPRLKLTLAGERMAEYARTILQETKRLNAELANITDFRMQRITLGVTRTSAIALLPQVLSRFYTLYPNISFVHVEGSTDQLIELLQKQTVDFCICANRKISGLSNLILAEESFCFAISKTLLRQQLGDGWRRFVESHSDGITLMDVKDFPLVMLPRENRLSMAVYNYFNANQVRPSVIVESAQVDLLYHFCKQGHGASILWGGYYYSQLKSTGMHDIFLFPIKDFLSSDTIGLIYPANAPQTKYYREFIQMVDETFTGYRNDMVHSDSSLARHNLNLLNMV